MKLRYLILFFTISFLSATAQFKKDKPTYQKYNGYFNFLYDTENGKIYLEVTDLEKEFLYVNSLSSGIGSNDIGLDRGQLGNEQVVYFKKMADKLFLIQPNLKYRALTDNGLEKKAVEQAFAQSILESFPILEKDGDSYYIDMSEFLMRDAHGVSDRLKRSKQGAYKLDVKKSAVNLDRTKAFPKNIEFDVYLTFEGSPEGSYIRSVTPNPKLVTVAQHHSFIELPESGFEKRAFDPRSGSYPFTYFDYASPVYESLEKRFIPRHRLEKKDPGAEQSEAVEPIVYYLDNGTPEPVRSALLEGGRWWNQAFEAAGYKDAFQLKMLPDDADPLDVRYNVIQWVHRSTRGWSYGASVVDPRTGEIIKGHVSLGSLRIRQDFMIAQALTDKPFANSDDANNPMLEMALARIRQLSAHEIGHTLGFAHNFAASTNGKASVMDYPHPSFNETGGKIVYTNAYDAGIGAWDKVTVAYAYSDFPEGTNEKEALNAILAEAQASGLRYISDQDARPAGSAHAYGHLWDNGTSPTEELEKVLKIRKTAIANFGLENIRTDEALSTLEDVFVPLYFFHRYQTEAAAKVIGGLEYHYAVRGDGMSPWKTVSEKMQKEALETLMHTLDASEIAIPEDKLTLFPPRAMGFRSGRESFKGRTGVSFDALAAAETAADMTLSFLLHPERASRLVQQQGLNPSQLGLSEVLKDLVRNTFQKRHSNAYLNEIQQVINFRVLYHLLALAGNTEVHPQVNAIANAQIYELAASMVKGVFDKDQDAIINREIARRVSMFRDHPEKFVIPDAPQIPDGSPIGMDCFH